MAAVHLSLCSTGPGIRVPTSGPSAQLPEAQVSREACLRGSSCKNFSTVFASSWHEEKGAGPVSGAGWPQPRVSLPQLNRDAQSMGETSISVAQCIHLLAPSLPVSAYILVTFHNLVWSHFSTVQLMSPLWAPRILGSPCGNSQSICLNPILPLLPLSPGHQ